MNGTHEAEQHLRRFAALVRDKLDADRRYYRLRTHAALQQARELEQRVDAEVRRILSTQGRLL